MMYNMEHAEGWAGPSEREQTYRTNSQGLFNLVVLFP